MNKMQIIYFSTALSDAIYNKIVEQCNTFKPTFSGVGFDRNVAVGLAEFAEVQGVSFYPIPSYPKYSQIVQKEDSFSKGKFNCFVPQMTDLPIIKEFSYYFNTKKYIKRKMTAGEDSVVVISGLYRSFLRPAKYLKKRYNIKVCAIVPDLPELMISYRKDYSKVRQILNKIDVKKSQEYRDCVDGFIFLSKYMDEPVNKNHKPYIVVDGLTDIASFPNIVPHEKEEEKIVLYAGKVSSTFGVDKLVKAFQEAEKSNVYKLYICGDGDYADQLRRIADADSSIVYLGSVPHSKVLELEEEASLLVDPRPSDMEIVKMSFPSKIIEYMASGTPVLTTNLPCFSEEYRNYQFRIDDESIEGMKNALEMVCSLSTSELNEKGTSAKEFILQNKTMPKQCERIMNFLADLRK